MLPTDDLSLMFLCRLCSHMAEAKEHGQDQCGQECGGPSRGMNFPCYKGQMPFETLVRFCFKCGRDAVTTRAVSGRCLGLCEVHAQPP